MKIEAQQTCGCCKIEMNFKSIAAAEAAFEKVGLTSSATIIDDDGIEHEGIDTFYGIWHEGQDEHLEGFVKLLSMFK